MIPVDDLQHLLPEICLASLALILQLLGVSKKYGSANIVCRLAILCMIPIAFLVINDIELSSILYDTYVVGQDNAFYKLLVLGSVILVILTYLGYIKTTNAQYASEYVTLVILIALGAFVAVSARDILVLFVALELQALASYVLAAFDKSNAKSSEAGVKYFVLGALSSCIMLLGISFLYGFSGSTLYSDVQNMTLSAHSNVGLAVGGALLIVGIAFKLSLAPFHIWTPDVYEGAPFVSVGLFSSALKIAIFVVTMNVLSQVVVYSNYLVWMLRVMAILSIIVGSIGAIAQNSIKRLIGYSTILNMGFACTALVINANANWHFGIVYIVIYAVTTIGLFSTLASSLGSNLDNATFADLEGVAKTKRIGAALISIFMFSMIGLPPFAGFFGKYYLLSIALAEQEYLLVFTMLVGSVISAYYYLKIIKAMYFCEASKPAARLNPTCELVLVNTLAIMFIVGFSLL